VNGEVRLGMVLAATAMAMIPLALLGRAKSPR
jgi:hypothetical protein